MADYYPVLARAIATLDQNNGEARRGVYERARTAIVKQLRGYEPPLSESEITRERLALEDAIRRIEAEHRAGRGANSTPQLAAPMTPLQTVRDAAADANVLGPATAAAQQRAAADRAALDGQPVPPAARVEPQMPAPARTGHAPADDEAASAPPQDERPARRTPAIVGIIVVLLLAGAGAAGVYLGSNQGAETAAQQIQAETDTPAKITDRISPDGEEVVQAPPPEVQEPAQPAVTPSAEQAPATARIEAGPAAEQARPAPPAAAPVAQNAVLYEADAEGGNVMSGSVAWRVVSKQDSDTGGVEQVFRGDVDIPERGIRMHIGFERNTDPTQSKMAYIVDIEFIFSKDVDFGGIASVSGVAAQTQSEPNGAGFHATMVKIGESSYAAGLFSAPPASTINAELMRQAGAFTIPVIYGNGRQAAFMLELGVSGRQAFNQVLAAWSQAAQSGLPPAAGR